MHALVVQILEKILENLIMDNILFQEHLAESSVCLFICQSLHLKFFITFLIHCQLKQEYGI